MSVLSSIEDGFGVKLPEGYRLWFEKGFTNYEDNESEYLWVYDGEWIQPSEIVDYETPRDRLIPGLIPFAFTGSGAPWAWSSSEETEPGEFEILLCNRDEELADVYAPTFAAWFYRQCLEYAVEGIENVPDEIEEARAYFRLWSSRMAEIGAGPWAEHLLEISNAAPVKYENFKPSPGIAAPPFSLVTEGKLNELVKKEIGERYLGTQTEWGWYDEE